MCLGINERCISRVTLASNLFLCPDYCHFCRCRTYLLRGGRGNVPWNWQILWEDLTYARATTRRILMRGHHHHHHKRLMREPFHDTCAINIFHLCRVVLWRRTLLLTRCLPSGLHDMFNSIFLLSLVNRSPVIWLHDMFKPIFLFSFVNWSHAIF